MTPKERQHLEADMLTEQENEKQNQFLAGWLMIILAVFLLGTLIGFMGKVWACDGYLELDVMAARIQSPAI